MSLPLVDNDVLIRAIGWTLLHSLWQGVLFAALLALLLRAMRSAPSTARYAVACGALAMLVASALATFIVIAQPSRDPIAAAAPRIENASGSFSIGSIGLVERPIAAPERIDPFYYLVLLYFAGAMIMCVWNIGGWLLVLRMRRGRVVESMQPVVARLAERMNVRRAVNVIESAAAQVPAVIGVFRPVLVVPLAMLSELSPQQVEAILAHELAHVRRQDYLVNLLQCAAETLMFYHPATWWISAQVRCERENCADDIAAQVCGDPRAYAAALASVESLRPASRQPALAPAATHGNLLARVRRVLQLPPLPRGVSPMRSLAAAVLAIACVIVPLACAAQDGEPVAAPTTAGPTTSPTAATAAATTRPSDLRITADRGGSDKQFLEIVIAMSGLHHANKYIDIETLTQRVAAMPEPDRRRTVLVAKADAPDVTVDHYFRHLADLHRLVAEQKLAYLSQAGIVEGAVGARKQAAAHRAAEARIEAMRAQLEEAKSSYGAASRQVKDLELRIQQAERRNDFDRVFEQQLRGTTAPAATAPAATAPSAGPRAAGTERLMKDLEEAQRRVESLQRALAAANGDPEAQYDQLLQQREQYRRMVLPLQGRLGPEHPTMKSAAGVMNKLDLKVAEYRTKATLSAAERLAANDVLLRGDLATLAQMEMNLAHLGESMGVRSRVYLDAQRDIEIQRERVGQHVDAVRARQRAAATATTATTSPAATAPAPQ